MENRLGRLFSGYLKRKHDLYKLDYWPVREEPDLEADRWFSELLYIEAKVAEDNCLRNHAKSACSACIDFSRLISILMHACAVEASWREQSLNSQMSLDAELDDALLAVSSSHALINIPGELLKKLNINPEKLCRRLSETWDDERLAINRFYKERVGMDLPVHGNLYEYVAATSDLLSALLQVRRSVAHQAVTHRNLC